MAKYNQIREKESIQRTYEKEAKAAANRIAKAINIRGTKIEVRPARTRAEHNQDNTGGHGPDHGIAIASFELAEEVRFGSVSLWRRAGEIVFSNYAYGSNREHTATHIQLLGHKGTSLAAGFAPHSEDINDKAAVVDTAVVNFTACLLGAIEAGRLKYPKPKSEPNLLRKFFG